MKNHKALKIELNIFILAMSPVNKAFWIHRNSILENICPIKKCFLICYFLVPNSFLFKIDIKELK